MDLDVFGGSSESKDVLFGSDSVTVVVKDNAAEQASNVSIPQAISELHLDTAEKTPPSAASEIKEEPEIKEDSFSTPQKKPKSRKRDTPSKDEDNGEDNEFRALRSSRSKINYDESKVVEPEPVTTPKISRKKELAAERAAAIQGGLFEDRMMPLEARELPEFNDNPSNYFGIRNNILKCWHDQPTSQLTKAFVNERIIAKYRGKIDRVFDFLERYGYINMGRFTRGASNTSETNTVPEMENARKKTIIVVGAGMSGLAAARQLDFLGYKVIVLEARTRVGGRVCTDNSFQGSVDLGGSIITGLEGNPITVLVKQLGLRLHPLGTACPLYHCDGTPVDSELDTKVEKLFNTLLDQSARFKIDPTLNLPEGCGKSLGKTFDYITNKQEPPITLVEKQILDWHCANLEYGCAAHLDLVDLHEWDQDDQYEFSGEHCMLERGYGSVADGLIEGLDIRYDSPIVEVRYQPSVQGGEGESGNNTQITLRDGTVVQGDAVLCTVPLGVLKTGNIKFSPSLPDWKSATINRLGFGLLNKVVMLFPNVFWDDEKDYFGITRETTVSRGEGYLFWNLHRVMKAPVLVALVAGEASFVPSGDNSVIDRVLGVLKSHFETVPTPVKTHLTRWHEDPFATGSYSYIGMGSSGADYDILGRSLGNLYFAGEATSREHPATVAGAYLSGLREAGNIDRDFCRSVERREVRDTTAAVVQQPRNKEKSSRHKVGGLSKKRVLSDESYEWLFASSYKIPKRTKLKKEKTPKKERDTPGKIEPAKLDPLLEPYTPTKNFYNRDRDIDDRSDRYKNDRDDRYNDRDRDNNRDRDRNYDRDNGDRDRDRDGRDRQRSNDRYDRNDDRYNDRRDRDRDDRSDRDSDRYSDRRSSFSSDRSDRYSDRYDDDKRNGKYAKFTDDRQNRYTGFDNPNPPNHHNNNATDNINNFSTFNTNTNTNNGFNNYNQSVSGIGNGNNNFNMGGFGLNNSNGMQYGIGNNGMTNGGHGNGMMGMHSGSNLHSSGGMASISPGMSPMSHGFNSLGHGTNPGMHSGSNLHSSGGLLPHGLGGMQFDGTQNMQGSFVQPPEGFVPPPPAPPAPSSASKEKKRKKDKKDARGGRFKDQVAEAVGGRLKKYKNAGRITTDDDFRHLARKLTHLCVEKERRHSVLMAAEELTVNSEIRKKIDKLVDSYFDKIVGVYHAN